MTTTVHVAITGNKEVKVQAGQVVKLVKPGAHAQFLIHGDLELIVQEYGGFINSNTSESQLVRDFTEQTQ